MAKGGRTKLSIDKKRDRHLVFLNSEEFNVLSKQKATLGLKSMSEFFRYKLLHDQDTINYINPVELISKMDVLGIAFARIGNNINQIAHHANILEKSGEVKPEVLERFNVQLNEYVNLKKDLLQCFKNIL